MMKKVKVRYIVILQCVYFFFSLFGICTKLAAQHPVFSRQFFVFYGLSLVNMFVYAVIWQIILKRMPLVVAYSNKAVTLLWGLLWGRCFFGEEITVLKLVGTVIVGVGIILVVSDGGAE